MAEAAAPTAASSRLPSPTPIIESQRRRSSSRRASQPFGRRSEGRRAESVTGATGHDFRATYEAKPTYGLQQGPAREVQLSQARNKALEKLGIGVSNAVNKAEEKPWISLLRPWFPSPDTEHDYQEAAYELHRRFLFQLLMFAGCSYLAITVGWTALAVRGQWQLVGRGALRGERAATIALRPLFGAACLLTAMLVLRSSLGPRPASVLCVAIIYLGAAVPFVDHARTDAGAAAPEEGVEVMLMYLIAYQLLVPIFQIRYIAAAMWTLMLAQQVYGLARYRESLAAHTTLQLREFARAMILNLLGTALGVVAEKNRRRNFMGAMLYHEEVVLMTAVRNDVQRLLLNTLPEPIVKEVASGKTEVRPPPATRAGTPPLATARTRRRRPHARTPGRAAATDHTHVRPAGRAAALLVHAYGHPVALPSAAWSSRRARAELASRSRRARTELASSSHRAPTELPPSLHRAPTPPTYALALLAACVDCAPLRERDGAASGHGRVYPSLGEPSTRGSARDHLRYLRPVR